MSGTERKEEKKKVAEVSNGNKSSKAEQFLPALSWSVDPISNLKKGLCLVALAVGRRAQSSGHSPPPPPFPFPFHRRCSLSRWCIVAELVRPVRGYFLAAPQPVTTA